MHCLCREKLSLFRTYLLCHGRRARRDCNSNNTSTYHKPIPAFVLQSFMYIFINFSAVFIFVKEYFRNKMQTNMHCLLFDQKINKGTAHAALYCIYFYHRRIWKWTREWVKWKIKFNGYLMAGSDERMRN